jgi:hypothetical protein
MKLISSCKSACPVRKGSLTNSKSISSPLNFGECKRPAHRLHHLRADIPSRLFGPLCLSLCSVHTTSLLHNVREGRRFYGPYLVDTGRSRVGFATHTIMQLKRELSTCSGSHACSSWVLCCAIHPCTTHCLHAFAAHRPFA